MQIVSQELMEKKNLTKGNKVNLGISIHLVDRNMAPDEC